MSQLLLPLGIIAAGFFIGIMVRRIQHRLAPDRGSLLIGSIMARILQLTVTLVFPLCFVAIFWNVDLKNVKLFVLPFLGVFALVSGGLMAIGAAKLLKLDRKQTGSMFSLGACTNIGSIGMIVCFALLGEESLALVGLYKLFEEFVYYLFVFPAAKSFSLEPDANRSEKRSERITKLLKDPYILISFSAIAVGVALNLSGLERPGFIGRSVGGLVSVGAFLMMLVFGYSNRIASIKRYLKAGAAIAVIKYALVPTAVVLLGFLAGLGSVQDGLALKTLAILASMSPAFTSLVPPRLYQLDMDLADAGWLFGTVLLVAVVPIQYMLVTWVL